MPGERPQRNSDEVEPRSLAARIAAVQVLYEIEMVGTPADTVLADFLERRAEASQDMAEDGEDGTNDAAADEASGAAPRAQLLAELVRGAQERGPELDPLIEKFLRSERGLDSVDLVLRAILRVGAYELAARSQVPARVVVSQYCDIAGAFFDTPQEALANAVLDRLARELRAEEFSDAPADGN